MNTIYVPLASTPPVSGSTSRAVTEVARTIEFGWEATRRWMQQGLVSEIPRSPEIVTYKIGGSADFPGLGLPNQLVTVPKGGESTGESYGIICQLTISTFSRGDLECFNDPRYILDGAVDAAPVAVLAPNRKIYSSSFVRAARPALIDRSVSVRGVLKSVSIVTFFVFVLSLIANIVAGGGIIHPLLAVVYIVSSVAFFAMSHVRD